MFTSVPWMLNPEMLQQELIEWNFRTPNIEDGENIHQLIANSPPLDVNSSYCNFLQSSHFNQTCVLAEHDGEIAGFISSYLKPNNPNELFIWQVAVDARHRGKGLAFEMLKALLKRDNLKNVKALETTITKNNEGSWNLFKKLDKLQGDHGSVSTFLDKADHFQGKHDTEYLYHIPITNPL